jgi:3-hydroxyacyl-[acyl-carrier-protein] dehydratase
MVSKPIIELDSFDLNAEVVSKEEILKLNAQREEFEQLDKLVYLDLEELTAVAVKKQTPEEFWTRGHIPGRPLMPGVLMIEMAAQLSSIVFHKKYETNGEVFFGFGGVNKVKFRGSVEPGANYVMMAKATKFRKRIAIFDVQGFVDGKMVFEGEITGVVV